MNMHIAAFLSVIIVNLIFLVAGFHKTAIQFYISFLLVCIGAAGILASGLVHLTN
jgi:hypothetical protein